MMHTYEAIYETGVIRLINGIRLPEHTKVYVLVPEASAKPPYRYLSPRLADPQQASNFVKEVIEMETDAPL